MINQTFHSGADWNAKLVCYQLLRKFNSNTDVDWKSICGTLFSDIITTDVETQRNALMTLPCLPLEEAKEFLKSYE